jgi:hypothetical protein
MSLAYWLADLSKVETALKLPADYIERLGEGDDWSYIIKAHALTEAYTVHAIGRSTDPRLSGLWDRLPFSGPASKVSVARSLGILDDSSVSFAERLSRVRNRLTHGVDHPEFNLIDYLERSAKGDLQGFASDIMRLVFDDRDQELEALLVSMLSEVPREILSLAHLAFIARMLFVLEPAEQARATEEMQSPKVVIGVIAVVLVAVLGASAKGPGETT